MFKPHPKQAEFFESEERRVLWGGAYPPRAGSFLRRLTMSEDKTEQSEKPKPCPNPNKPPSIGELAFLQLLKIKMDGYKTYTAKRLHDELGSQWKEVSEAAKLAEGKKEKK